nr:hypothetical protein [Thiobacillus sp.]
NSFIHNILWYWRRLDTNSRCPARYVNPDPDSREKIFRRPENPETNQYFHWTGCLKFAQHRAGAGLAP